MSGRDSPENFASLVVLGRGVSKDDLLFAAIHLLHEVLQLKVLPQVDIVTQKAPSDAQPPPLLLPLHNVVCVEQELVVLLLESESLHESLYLAGKVGEVPFSLLFQTENGFRLPYKQFALPTLEVFSLFQLEHGEDLLAAALVVSTVLGKGLGTGHSVPEEEDGVFLAISKARSSHSNVFQQSKVLYLVLTSLLVVLPRPFVVIWLYKEELFKKL